MGVVLSYNELRGIKDALPSGCLVEIAKRVGVSVEEVRTFFGAHNFIGSTCTGVHVEPGPDGGIVVVDNPRILEAAFDILKEQEESF